MKRYCLVDDKSNYGFQKKDLDSCYDISFKRLLDQTIPPQFKWTIESSVRSMFVNNPDGRMDFYLEYLPYSSELRVDILNEVYLSLEYIANTKTELLSDNDLDNKEFSDKIVKGIRSLGRKENRIYTNEIFDVDAYLRQTKGIDMNLRKIPTFGSGVMKLWLGSKDLKTLLNETTGTYKKYRIDEIIKIVEKNEKKEKSKTSGLKVTVSTDKKSPQINEELDYNGVLEYSRTDAIILERILGISELREVQEYVAPQLKGNETGISDLLQSIRQYHGEYVRCYLIRLIGCCLYERGHKNRLNDENEILVGYKLKIDRYRDVYNEIYVTIHNQILKKYGKNYTLQTAKNLIEENIKWTKEMFYLSMPMTPLIKKLKVKMFKELMEQEAWDEVFQILSGARNRIPDFCFEYKKGSYERNKFKEFDLPDIEKNIIDANRLYYRWGEN